MSNTASAGLFIRIVRLALIAALTLQPLPLPALGTASHIPDHAARGEAPKLAPSAPSIAAAKTDALLIDNDGDGKADVGDTLRYTVIVTNTGDSDALGVVFSDTLDANTTLSGTLQTTPLARNNSYTTTLDTALDVAVGNGLLSNDSGTPAPTVTPFSGSTAHGAVTVRADGSFIYTPTLGFSSPPSDTFTYTAVNAWGSDSASVTIDVQAAPVANDDGYTATKNVPLTIAAPGVLSNDTGSPTPAVVPFSGPTAQGGAVTINADGSFVYTPTLDFVSPPDDTFVYTATNFLGSDSATVSIQVRDAPIAVDDPNYATLANTPLNVPDGAGDLLGNDTLGAPPGTLVSFGGGSLGGSVTDYAAGTTATFGGLLTVNANGSFSFTPTLNFTGVFTFAYRLQNAAGFDDALATVTVRQAPDAVDDDPGGVAAYAVNTGGTLTVNAASGVIQRNDNPGFPAAALASFGGGSLGGSVTDNAAGAGVALVGGTLTVNGDGSFLLATPTLTGTFTFLYRLTNAAGFDDATVTLSVQAAPAAVDDPNYATLANTPLNVPDGAGDLLGNDTLGFPTATLTSFGGGSLGGSVTDYAAGTTATFGGSLTVNANGSFSFTPTLNFTGVFTFAYRLQNVAGFDDALATIVVQKAPDAVDDDPGGVAAYTVIVSGTLNVNAASGVVQRNDDVGFPAATLTSFGGGSLGGSVTDNAAGAGVALAGGTLTVNGDGSFTLATPTLGGTYTFLYRLSNAAGFDDAMVTLSVQAAPDAVDDGPAPGSNPGDPYHTAFNTPLNVPDGPTDLLANDTLGLPAGTLVSFGGGSLGGSVTDHAAGTTATFGGSLTVNANGSFSFTPTLGFVGLFTFTYRLQNAIGFDDASVTLAVGARAAANADGRNVLGNVQIDTASIPFSVLDNDAGDGLGLAAYQATSANGGQVVVNTTPGASLGQFTYNPPPGFEGSDTFTYTIGNSFNTSVATVTLTVNDVIWFIDHSAGSGGDGRITSPFNGVAAFNSTAADEPGDILFLYELGGGSYSGNFTLLNTQQLIGQGVNLAAVTGITPPAGSLALPGATSNPTLINGSGNGITLGQNNTIRGLTVGNTTGADIVGSSFGTLTVTNVTLNGTGQALALTTGALAATFDNVSSSSSATTGLSLNGVGGSLSVAGATGITGPSGDGVNVQNSTGSFNFGALNITNTGGRGLFASNGGALTAGSGAITTTNNAAIAIDNTTLALTLSSVSSTNSAGAGIDLASVSGAFNASGGSISGPAGVAILVNGGAAAIAYGGAASKTSSGRLVDIQNRTGGSVTLSNNLTCNTACSGIFVNGNSGGTITFSGATKTVNTGVNTAVTLSGNTGATINFSGGGLDLDTTSGAGFSASGGTVSVSGVNNTATSTTGRAITMTNTTIGASGVTFQNVSANGAVNGINLSNVSGNFTVSGGTIQNTSGHGIQVSNSSAGPLNFTLQNSTVTNAASGQNGINFEVPPAGAGSFGTVLIQNNTVSNNGSTGLRANIQGTGSMGLINIGSNTFTGNPFGVDLVTNGTASIDFDIHDNPTMNGERTQVNIAANDLVHNNGVGPTMEGYIRNNTITTSPTGSTFIAVWVVSDGDGNITIDINNNTVTNFGDSGIDVESRGGTGDVHARIANNSASTTATFPLAGLFLRSGNGTVGETNLLCVNVSSNNMNAGSGAVGDYYLDRFLTATTFQIQGLTPASATPAQAEAYIVTTDSAPPATAFAENGTYTAATCSTVSFAAAQLLTAETSSRTRGLAAPISRAARAVTTTLNYSVGALPPGKSITLIFDVTITDPLPENVTQVSNQGQVEGSNFTTIVTDDPDTVAPNDPTVTVLDVATNPSVTTIYLPLVARHYAAAPDLVVQAVNLSGSNVQVVIKNQGGAAVADEFYVDLYVNPNPVPTGVNQVWDDGRSTQGIVWGVLSSAFPALQPGGVLTLTLGDAYILPALSNFSGPLPAGAPVYVQVDSANTLTTYGGVLENHEIAGGAYNNILGPITVSAALPGFTIRDGSSSPSSDRLSALPRR